MPNKVPDLERGLIAKIHVAKKELGYDDDRYRAMLVGLTGKDSCKDMSLSELDKVLKAMRGEGFAVKVRRSPPAPLKEGGRRGEARKVENTPGQKKIWALWFVLVAAGKATRSAKALNAFIKRQTEIEAIEWVKTSAQEKSVIEALKGWIRREGLQ